MMDDIRCMMSINIFAAQESSHYESWYLLLTDWLTDWLLAILNESCCHSLEFAPNTIIFLLKVFIFMIFPKSSESEPNFVEIRLWESGFSIGHHFVTVLIHFLKLFLTDNHSLTYSINGAIFIQQFL